MANPKRILVVEDHDDSRAALVHTLSILGYTADGAATLSEARKFCEQNTYDVLLGDIQMPDGDSYGLMKELAGKYPIKGIVYTGFSEEHDMGRAIEAGYSAYLIKPASIAKLQEAIESLSAPRMP